MFRNAEEKDFALYMELAQEFYHSPAVMHPIPAQYMENTFREAMRSDVYIILRILEVDGEAAGYAILSRSFSPESGSPICWIEELYIRKAYRGHGLGTKFFSSVRKEFPTARLRLEVEPENTGAVALYKRLGFTPLEYVSYVVEPDGADEQRCFAAFLRRRSGRRSGADRRVPARAQRLCADARRIARRSACAFFRYRKHRRRRKPCGFVILFPTSFC